MRAPLSRVVGALIIGVAGLVLADLSLEPVARAAMPGANGKIVFESDRNDSNDVFVMNADGCLSFQVPVVFAHYWMEELMADADVLKCTDTGPRLQHAVLAAE